jgi:hypothetical protein
MLALAGVSEKGDWTQTQDMGDRALAVYYVAQEKVTKPTYRFSTYNLWKKKTEHNQVSLPWENFEGSWYYIYSSYSSATRLATGYVHLHGTDDTYEVRLNNKKHNSKL